jgi:hypothetical protein
MIEQCRLAHRTNSASIGCRIGSRWRPAKPDGGLVLTVQDKQAEELLPGPDVIGETKYHRGGTLVVAPPTRRL